MRFHKRAVVVIIGCAAVILPSVSRAQTPTWALSMLDTPPTVTATTGVTPFDRAVSFGSPLLAGLPLPEFTYSFVQGTAPTPGKIELGVLAKETDDPATGFTIFVVPGSINNLIGTLPLNNDSTPNGPMDFFEQNTADITNPLGDPTWASAQISAGNSLTLDLGTLDLTKLLAFYDAQGPGSYLLTLNIGVSAFNASNGAPLDPDPNIPGNSLPRVPGPPTVEVQITVSPQVATGVPEPGTIAMLVGMTIAGGTARFRRRRSG